LEVIKTATIKLASQVGQLLSNIAVANSLKNYLTKINSTIFYYFSLLRIKKAFQEASYTTLFNADVTTNVAYFLNDFDLTPRHHLSGNYLKNAGSLSRIIVAVVAKSLFAVVYLISDISLVITLKLIESSGIFF